MDYYRSCFSLVDCFHFNSNVSKAVYTAVLPDVEGKVVPITHRGIKDNRRIKSFDGNRLRIGFVGSEEPFKGLPFLVEVLKTIEEDDKWELSVWGGRVAKHPSLPVYYRGKFMADTMESVYAGMDVLIVPSVWKETFSLVTLEALSYGVPVIVSDNVGAQDVVKEYNPRFVYHTTDELKNLLTTLVNDKSLLIEYNKCILTRNWMHDIKKHASDIVELIYK